MSESDTKPSTVDVAAVDIIQSSTYRQRVMQALRERARTPTELAEECDLSIAHVSRALSELRDRDLVELLVPEEQRKGRIYGVTDGGREVFLKFIEEETE